MDPLLRLHTAVLEDVVVVRCHGELDLSSGAGLLDGLAPAVALADHAVVLDLSDLVFIDCAGASSLVAARTEIARCGIEVVLAAPSRPAARLLSLTGTGELIPIFPTVRQAVNKFHRVSTATGSPDPTSRTARVRPRVPPPRGLRPASARRRRRR